MFFSLFCLVTEMTDLFDDTENMMAFFMLFHLIGVSSVCTNPILYGFLNDNYKKVGLQLQTSSQSSEMRQLYSNLKLSITDSLTHSLTRVTATRCYRI